MDAESQLDPGPENDDHSTELRFATDEQIIDELTRRYNAVVLVMESDKGHQATPGCRAIPKYYRGGYAVCLGLVRYMDHWMLNGDGCDPDPDQEEDPNGGDS